MHRVWLVWLVLLAALAPGLGRPNAPAEPLLPPALAAAAAPKAADAPTTLAGAQPTSSPPAATCRVTLLGGAPGSISIASIDCSGGPVSLVVDAGMLGGLASSGFRGVSWAVSKEPGPCLVSVVGQTDVVFVDSVIRGVHTARTSNVRHVLCAADSSRLELRRSHISNNTASGVAAMGASCVVLLGSVVGMNKPHPSAPGVGKGGSGIMVLDAATVVITEASSVSGNVRLAGKGAGIQASGRARLVVSGGSSISNNTNQKTAGGGVALYGAAVLRLEGGSHVRGNRAVIGSGGGVALYDSSVLEVRGASDVSDNTANEHGGGIHAEGDSRVLLTGGSALLRNRAKTSGGGLYCRHNVSVVVSNHSVLANNSGGSGGAAVVAGDAVLHVTRASTLSANVAVDGYGGGLVCKSAAVCRITDGVHFVNNRQGNNLLPGTELGDGNFSAAAGRDIVIEHSAQLHLDPSVRTDDGRLSLCSRTVLIVADACPSGTIKDAVVCECCPPFTYCFGGCATLAGCQPCPQPGAVCPGGNVVLPQAGWWHSSPQWTQMHQCPIQSSCLEGGGCADGYHGPLCAACQSPTYGFVALFRCKHCMAVKRQLVLYLVAVCFSVAFVTCTVHFTWRDNCEQQQHTHVRASDHLKSLIFYVQYVYIIGTYAPYPNLLQRFFTVSTSLFGAVLVDAMSLDCLLSHYARKTPRVPLVMQRALLQFMAPVGLAAIVVVALFVCRLVATGWKARSRNRSCLQLLRAAGQHTVKTLPIIAVVAVFLAFPSLVRAGLRLFACLRIDDASLPDAQYALYNHSAGYLEADITQECFSGWHLRWALGFGLPAVLGLCVGVPLGLFVFLYTHRSRARDPAFQERFGWLYRNYKNDRMWWEAVWAGQTVLLSAVTVFQFHIEAYTAILLFSVLFVGSAAAQIAAKPYAYPQLHHLQLTATACLFITAQSTLVLFHPHGRAMSGVQTVPVAIGLLLLCIHGLFVVSCLLAIVLAALGPGSAAWKWVGRHVGGCILQLVLPTVPDSSFAGPPDLVRIKELAPGSSRPPQFAGEEVVAAAAAAPSAQQPEGIELAPGSSRPRQLAG